MRKWNSVIVGSFRGRLKPNGGVRLQREKYTGEGLRLGSSVCYLVGAWVVIGAFGDEVCCEFALWTW